MSIKPIYEEKEISGEEKKLKGECKVSAASKVDSADVSKIYATQIKVFGDKQEVKDGFLTCTGRAVFCFAYLSVGGDIKKSESASEFECKIPIKGDIKVKSVSLCGGETTVDASTSQVTLKGKVYASADVLGKEKINKISGGDNLIFKTTPETFLKKTETEKTVEEYSEEFSVNYAIKEVLFHNENLIVTAVQCGVETIIIDGDLNFSMCLLQNGENSDILKEAKVLPFRLEIKAPEAMPSFAASGNATLKDVKLNIVVDEEKNKSTVTLDSLIELTGEFYEESTEETITDAYSTENEVSLTFTEVKREEYAGEKTAEAFINAFGSFSSPLKAGSRMTCSALESLSVTSLTAENGGLKVVGTINCTAFCKDSDGEIFSTPATCPFETVLDAGLSGEKYASEVTIENFSARISSLETFSAQAVIKARIIQNKTKSLSLLTGIEEGEERKKDDCFFKVYVANSGEELWDVAKRLGVKKESVTDLNQDIVFPLGGDERIVIYKQDKVEY